MIIVHNQSNTGQQLHVRWHLKEMTLLNQTETKEYAYFTAAPVICSKWLCGPVTHSHSSWGNSPTSGFTFPNNDYFS
jgi:hypothetical protein